MLLHNTYYRFNISKFERKQIFDNYITYIYSKRFDPLFSNLFFQTWGDLERIFAGNILREKLSLCYIKFN